MKKSKETVQDAESKDLLLQKYFSTLPFPPSEKLKKNLTPLFRQYDIRGIVTSKEGQISGEWEEESALTPMLAYAIGCAYGRLVYQKLGKTEKPYQIAVGYDARLSGPLLAQALELGLRRMGMNVLRLGLVPTPVVYYACHELQAKALHESEAMLSCHGGIAVTGSHNPSAWNGFKLGIGTDSIYGEDLQTLAQFIMEGLYTVPFSIPTFEDTRGIDYDLSEKYLASLHDRLSFGQKSLHNLKVVIDAGHGASGPLALRFFKSLGVQVKALYCEPNGLFPAHHPDPTVEKNLQDLKEAVLHWGADIGLGFDGDGDRIGVVDAEGVVLWGDQLLLLFAQAILAQTPGATIIGEVKCSELLYRGIEEAGGHPEMWKVGHSLIKARMKECQAPLAGEMSGHLFFADRFYGFDDALYAAARLVECLSEPDFYLHQWRKALPQMINTPELRVFCADKDKVSVITKISEVFSKQYKVSTIDGVRIAFEKGWGLVRASNTQPVLVLRFEAQTNDLLDEYQSRVESWLRQNTPEVRFDIDPNH